MSRYGKLDGVKLSYDERRAAVVLCAVDRGADEDTADAIAGEVMADWDEDESEDSFWSLVDDTIVCHLIP